MTKVRGGLIQMALKAPTEKSPEEIRKAMIDAHVPLIEKAGGEGVQILCFQEVFTQPYFCPSQDSKWYAAAERIPDGRTVKLMQEFARKYQMVIVVPIYEEAMTGVYYNTAAVIDADGSYMGKYRKTHIPQVAGFWEKFFFKPGASEFPVFKTRYCQLGVYICYDRHFPEGWRALALNGAEYIVNPSATVAGLSEYLWKLEQPASAVANEYFIGAINRVGIEELGDNDFYGTSYFVDPEGKFVGETGDPHQPELIVRDLDMALLAEVRDRWAFYRDRRPEAYESLVKP